jgi:uncharacterized protein with GYD domain
MPKFLWKASYSVRGAKGVASSGGSARRDVVDNAVKGLGGTLEAFYFAFGDTDAYVIADLPDNESAAAIALAVNSTEGASLETVVLVTPEEIDAAANKQVDFTPAGG